MMQAAMGKLKPTGIYEIIKAPGFKPSSSSARKPLRAMVLANLHLFSQKQKKSLEEALSSWGAGSDGKDGGGKDGKDSGRDGRDGGRDGRDRRDGRDDASDGGERAPGSGRDRDRDRDRERDKE